MKSFRKKPVVIQAFRWTKKLKNNSPQWLIDLNIPGTINQHLHKEACPDSCLIMSFVIETLEGQMIAKEGDWIIRGVKGEFYPVREDIFEMTYEEVHENNVGMTQLDGGPYT